jgi:hypothetical protein
VGLVQSWLDANWFNFIQTAGILFGLSFTALGFRRDLRERRLANLFALKAEHRELWSIVHENPRLARVLDPDADLLAAPLTHEEVIFLRQLIVHFAVAWQSLQAGMPLDAKGFEEDAAAIFNLPLPRAAWREVKNVQHPGFVQFVEKVVGKRR